MSFDVLKNRVSTALIVLFTVFALSACSDKDDDEPQIIPAEPENVQVPYIGAWYCDFGDGDLEFVVFDEPNRLTVYETTKSLYKKGEYEEKLTGTYTYSSASSSLRCAVDGEIIYLDVMTRNGETYLVGDDDEDSYTFERVSRESLPTKEASYDDDNDDNDSDVFSNTTWKVTNILGGGAYAIDEYRGMQLRFGSNGTVTEWYSSSESYSGTYTVTGNKVTFNKIPLVNAWGWDYTYTISGSTLTLKNSETDQFNTSFVLTKM